VSGAKIKICGITNETDLEAALTLGADAIGFNFYRKSSRYVSPAHAAELCKLLPEHVWAVGVFVNEPRHAIRQVIETSGIDTLQLHGEEQDELSSGWEGLRLIRALRLRAQGLTRKELEERAASSDFILFDKEKVGEFGGTGEEIEEEILASDPISSFLPHAFLAGGITPENVRQKLERFHPFGIDVASGVESGPGRKDHARMRQLFAVTREISY
jgi:phosphoribosylanthranilate isomerase